MTPKKFLFVLRKPPYSGVHSQEILDIAMTTAAFDQTVDLLLLDQAVFQLKQLQKPGDFGMKDTASMFKSLPLLDIKRIYAETESLLEYGLTIENLEQPVTTIERDELGALFKQFDLIISD